MPCPPPPSQLKPAKTVLAEQLIAMPIPTLEVTLTVLICSLTKKNSSRYMPVLFFPLQSTSDFSSRTAIVCLKV